MPDRSGTVSFKKSENKTNRNPLAFTQTLTARGFGKVLFRDYYDKECSLQVSSASSANCIWLGIENAEPRILATDAIRLGLIKYEDAPHNLFGEPCGWIDYPIPKEALLSTRMHLTSEQAKQLGLQLLKFAFTGSVF